MLVKVFTFEKGIELYEEVNGITINSKDYNLLILKDYLPITGYIDGSVEIAMNEGNKKIENIHGYYVHADNVFSLLLEGV